MNREEMYNEYVEKILPLMGDIKSGKKTSLTSDETAVINKLYKGLNPSFIGCVPCSVKNILDQLEMFYQKEKNNYDQVQSITPEVQPEKKIKKSKK